jgi:RNA polymerase sigma-70 factor (ECF subfamily)
MSDSPVEPRDARVAFESEALVHLDGVYCFARSLTQDDATAEDLTQDTYLNAWRSWHQYRPGTNCRAWLFTICRNLRARQQQRERRTELVDTAELDALASAALHAAVPETERDGGFFDMPEFGDALREALAKLPEEYRETVVLADVHDQSYPQIARILGVPVGTVKSRLFRGRRLLQESLLAFARDAGIVSPTGA